MGGNFGKGKSRTTMNKLPRHANVGCLHDQVGFLNRVKTWRWRDIYLHWDFILFENVCLTSLWICVVVFWRFLKYGRDDGSLNTLTQTTNTQQRSQVTK